jgi:hypothetical protein
MKEHRLRVFENRVLRIIFGPWRDLVKEGGESCIMRSFMSNLSGTCSHGQVYL